MRRSSVNDYAEAMRLRYEAANKRQRCLSGSPAWTASSNRGAGFKPFALRTTTETPACR